MNESITKHLFLSGRDRAAEVNLRKELQEKERQQKLEVKRKEQEERLKRIGEHKNQLILQRAREKAERDLQKSKAVIDRRIAQLEQEKVRKEEILSKAHSATSRTAQNSPKKIFAFGSSTPRELSYLEKLSKDQKQYDRRLAPSTPSSGASPSITPPRDSNPRNSSVTRGPKVMLGSNMTSSLYVPQKAKPAVPRVSPPKRTSPPKPAAAATSKANPMTQSLYVPKKSSPARAPKAAKVTTPNKRPQPSAASTPAQRKPPLPKAPPAARAPPKSQPIEKTEAPKPKVIVPRKAAAAATEPVPTVLENKAVQQIRAESEGMASPPSSPADNQAAEEHHQIQPQEIIDAVEIAQKEESSYDESETEESKVTVAAEPKSLQDELSEANQNINYGDEEDQIIIDNHQIPHNIEEVENQQSLDHAEHIFESVDENYKNMESEVKQEIHHQHDHAENSQHIHQEVADDHESVQSFSEQITTENGHDEADSHNISYSIDDAISGIANLQLQTPQKDSSIVSEQNFVDFDSVETPLTDSQPPQFIQGSTQVNDVDQLDLAPLKKNEEFMSSEEKLVETNNQNSDSNGKETSRIDSPDQGPFSSSSSAKESDAENTDITQVSDAKKEKPTERKLRLSEIMAKARQGMSISPPSATNGSTTTNNDAASDAMNQSLDAKLLALKLIEQRRQEKLATGIENENLSTSENISDSESTIAANNGSNNGQRLSLAEEMAVAKSPPKHLDHLPGQPISYDNTDYHIMNGKTTPPEDPSHVQLV